MAAKVTRAPSRLNHIFEITGCVGADDAAAATRLGSHLVETIEMLGAFSKIAIP